jgi:MFS family permease
MAGPAQVRTKEKLYYGWMIVLACFGINAVVHGIRYSFGVFFKSLGGEFELNRAATSGISSAYWILCAGFALLGGYLLDKYGPRKLIIVEGLLTGISLIATSLVNASWQLFFTYSLLLSAGTGAVYSVLMSTAQRWFIHRRGTATGIVSSGVGIGTLIMSPLAACLVATFDWRFTYLLMGLVLGAMLIALAFPLKKDPSEINPLPGSGERNPAGIRPELKTAPPVSGFDLSRALKTRNFWLIGAIWFFWSFSLMLVMTHLVPHLTDIGISAATAALIIGLIGIISSAGRLGGGWLSDKLDRKIAILLSIVFQAGALFLLAWSQPIWMFYLFAAFFALGYGGLDPSTMALVGDTFGMKKLGSILGALMVFWTIGAGAGSAAGGILFDITGSYFSAFLITAVFMLLSGLCAVLTQSK